MKALIKKTTVGQILVFSLKKGESINVEPGAIISATGDIEIKSGISGGLGTGLLRAVGGGESLFINTVTALEDADVEIGAVMPSEMAEIDLDGALILGDGVYLAHVGDIKITSRFGGLTSLAAGSGLMFLYAEGKGKLYITAAESLHQKELKAGEKFYLDNSCFVGANADAKIEKFLAGKGLLSKVVGGEGVMLKFTGPATVFYQSESPRSLASYLAQFISRK